MFGVLEGVLQAAPHIAGAWGIVEWNCMLATAGGATGFLIRCVLLYR